MELFLRALTDELFLNNTFMYSVFGLAIEDNDYIEMSDKEFFVKIGEVKYGPFNIDNPALYFQEEITIPKGTIPLIKTDVKTTIGIAVLNQILLGYGLSNKYDFQPDGIDGHALHKRLIRDLQDDTSNIVVEDYKRWSTAIMYIRNQAQLFIVSNTDKTITKPDWLDKYMREVADEFTKEHTESWKSDQLLVLTYEKKIMAKYAEYLKDDPTWGIITSGKVFKQSMKKRYVSIGIVEGIGGESGILLSRLADGYKKDADELAAVFNNIIHGSYARGTQVVTAGVTSKRLVEALHQYKVENDDCGTTKGYPITVTKGNIEYLIGTYYISNKKIIQITNQNSESLLGKEVLLRFPTYCESGDGGFCKTCVGDKIGRLKGGIPLVAIMTGGMGVSFFMSKFHATQRGLYKIGIGDLK